MSKKEKLQDQPTPEEIKAPETELTETNEPVPEEQEAPKAPEINWEEKYNAEHDTYLRLAAEFDNFRKRTTKEKDCLLYTSDAADE